MQCWICFDNNNLYKCCNCKNDFKLAHKKCIYKLIINSTNNRNNCTFCNSKYKLSIYYRILLYLNIIYTFIKKEYNLILNQVLVQKFLLDNIINGCL